MIKSDVPVVAEKKNLPRRTRIYSEAPLNFDINEIKTP